MAYSITMGGTDLSGASYGLTVVGHPIQVLPDIRLHTMPYGAKHGAAAQGAYYAPIYFTIDWYIVGSTRANCLTKLDAVLAIMDPTLGEQLLTIDAFSGWGWYALLNGPINTQERGSNAISGQFNFIVPDGYRVAASATSQSVSVAGSTYWNTPASGTVAGNLLSEPVWTLTNTHASAVTSVALANTTRSETLTWTGSLVQNAILRIDTEREYVDKSTDGGTTYSGAMSGVAAASEFPHLTPAVVNACSLVGVTTGGLTIVYRARSL